MAKLNWKSPRGGTGSGWATYSELSGDVFSGQQTENSKSWLNRKRSEIAAACNKVAAKNSKSKWPKTPLVCINCGGEFWKQTKYSYCKYCNDCYSQIKRRAMA